MKNIQNEVNKVLKSGFVLMMDLLTQANNLSVTLSKEVEERGTEGITSRALKTSLVMMIFNSIEAYCNFTSQLIFHISTQDSTYKNKISQAEIDFLLEQETFLDTRTGNLKIRRNAYFSILDKMTITPMIFAKIHGGSFKLDKSSEKWRRFVKFKESRDESTHIKFDITQINTDFNQNNLLNQSPVYQINNFDLFYGIDSIREYVFTFNEIIRKYYPSNALLMGVIDLLYWMNMMNLRDVCGIDEKVFEQLRTPPVNSKDKDIIA